MKRFLTWRYGAILTAICFLWVIGLHRHQALERVTFPRVLRPTQERHIGTTRINNHNCILSDSDISLINTSLPKTEMFGPELVDFHELDQDSICKRVAQQSLWKHAVVGNVLKASFLSPPEVILVTQLSKDRLNRFVKITKQWEGPISVAVLVQRHKVVDFLQHWCSLDSLRSRRNILLHIVLDPGGIYPSNVLRNTAVKLSVGRYFYLVDVDVIPMRGMQKIIEKQVTLILSKAQRKILIIPTFEAVLGECCKEIPRNKSRMLKLWDKGVVRPFYITQYKPAYLPTLYDKWKNSTEPYKVQYYRQFEPYFVVGREMAHEFNQEIIGIFFDKASNVYTYFMRGFDFVVLPDVFNLHLPHSQTHNKSLLYYQCVKDTWRQSLLASELQYKKKSIVFDEDVMNSLGILNTTEN